MTIRVSELVEGGCFACGANLITAGAYVAIAEHRIVLADGDGKSPVIRRPVVVCSVCVLPDDSGEKTDG